MNCSGKFFCSECLYTCEDASKPVASDTTEKVWRYKRQNSIKSTFPAFYNQKLSIFIKSSILTLWMQSLNAMSVDVSISWEQLHLDLCTWWYTLGIIVNTGLHSWNTYLVMLSLHCLNCVTPCSVFNTHAVKIISYNYIGFPPTSLPLRYCIGCSSVEAVGQHYRHGMRWEWQSPSRKQGGNLP